MLDDDVTRRKRDRSALNRIFGTELPQESSDERDHDSRSDDADRDRWLRENLPPHHI